jgi:hypothetical protein
MFTIIYFDVASSKIIKIKINSIPLEGKNEVLTLDTVGLLVSLLKDQDPLVRSKAALAIEA